MIQDAHRRAQWEPMKLRMLGSLEHALQANSGKMSGPPNDSGIDSRKSSGQG